MNLKEVKERATKCQEVHDFPPVTKMNQAEEDRAYLLGLLDRPWISVKERLPEKGQRVLTWDGREYRIIPTDVFVSILPSDVTYWQHLPAPPESEVGE